MTTPATGAVGPRPAEPSRQRPDIGWTEMVVAAVTYLVLLATGAAVVLNLAGDDTSGVTLVVMVAAVTLAAAGAALAVRVRSVAPLRLGRVGVRWLLVGAGAGVAVFLVNRLVVLAYVTVTGNDSNPQQNLADTAAAGGLQLLLLLVAGAVLVPFAEEVLFRGIGYNALRRYGVGVAAVGSAVLFGLAHGISVVLPAAIIVGVVTALLYEHARSIWPAFLAHAVNNALLLTLAAVLL